MKILVTFCFLFLNLTAFSQKRLVNIIKVNAHVFVHESFLQTEQWGSVGCNGMIYINQGKALIFDTPANIPASNELINIVQDSLKAKIIGVVVNHFHNDCLAGLSAFHALQIPSYAHYKTLEQAKANNYEIPQIGFDQKQIISVGNQNVENYYFGPAHTSDNIVSYVPSQNVVFGGCMVKSLNAEKGYLGDANLKEWSNTVRKIKILHPKMVIPGHGKFGSSKLLDYTIDLFETN